ncbi:hypothetical protein D3C76_663870 [compost metagenome]
MQGRGSDLRSLHLEKGQRVNQQNLADFIWNVAVLACFDEPDADAQPPRPLAEIDADLKAVEAEIAALLGEVTA